MNHPHICTIYDIENTGGQSFIAMELLQGPALQRLLLRGALKSEQALELAIQIADALDAAHRKKLPIATSSRGISLSTIAARPNCWISDWQNQFSPQPHKDSPHPRHHPSTNM